MPTPFPAALDARPLGEAPTLVERLLACAQSWALANDATLARLGRTVVNDGGYFSRVDSPEASTTTATLEKFARFLGDTANWPGGTVPDPVRQFVAVIGVPAPEQDAA